MLTLTKNRSLVVFFLFITIASSGCEEDNDAPATSSDDESLIDPAIQPRIISTYPPANGVGPFRVYNQGDGSSLPHFVVQFNKLMDRNLVRDGISVSGFDNPADLTVSVIGGSARYSDAFSFVVNDSILFGRMTYSIGRRYVVSFDTSIVDINGNKLYSTPIEFLPEPFFRVISVAPGSQETNVSVSTSISVRFNSPVDSEILPSLALSPSAPGTWYTNGSVVSFSQSEYFPNLTVFTISVATTARDTLGNSLPAPFSSRFTTRGFAVESVSPTSYTNSYNSVLVSFSAPIDTSTIRQNFTVVPEIDGSLEFPSSRGFRFVPRLGFLSSQTYSVTLENGVRSAAGDSLPAAYSWSFYVDQFRVDHTSPSNGESFVLRTQQILLFFNGWLDTASVASQISTTPPIPGTIRLSPNLVTITPSDSLLPSQGYSVRVSTGVRSLTGDSLEYPYFLYFSTGN